MRNEAVEKLQEIISESSSIVFFGGAGVSTESGIPDFRSVDGLYHQQWDYPPEVILSHSFFMKKPEEFYRFYRAKMLCEAQPNEAHKKLAALEKTGRESSQAEVMSMGGTSLSVYPAASLIDYFRGSHLVVINRDPTPRDNGADLVISQPIGEVFGQIQEQ